MGIAILRLVAVLPLTLAAGCSTTSYVTAVTTFSDDATKVHTAFGDLIAQERDAAAANAEYLTLDKGYPFTVSASCNAPREPPDPSTPLNFQGIDCNGLYLADGGWKPVVPYAAGPHALDLASKLDAYGKALLGLAQAKDVAEVKDAANKAAATVAALATTVGGPYGPAIGAGVSLAAWLFGQYEDRLRLEQLKDIVASANALVGKAAGLLKRDAQELVRNIFEYRSIALTGDATELALNRKRLPRDAAKQRMDAILGNASQLQALTQVEVEAPFDAMATAHAKLLAVLNDPELSTSDLFTTLNDFTSKIDAVNTALSTNKGGK